MNAHEENTEQSMMDDAGISADLRDGGSVADGSSIEPLHFKILCPLSITGLIIGRGGTIINQLNNTCGAKIRLSQNHEYFPGTQDRVLLLKGDRMGIANALRELVTRIAEAPEKKNSSNFDSQGNPMPQANRGPQGTFQVKVLIPKLASASIIGKSGAVIKRMSEVSGARFQLGDEVDPFNTKERIVTISSYSVQNLVSGAVTLMNQLFDEARVRTYANLTTNYSMPANGGGFGSRPMMPPAAHVGALPSQQPPTMPNMAMNMMHAPAPGQMFTPSPMLPPHIMMQNEMGQTFLMPPPSMSQGHFPMNEMNMFPYGPPVQQVPMMVSHHSQSPLNHPGQVPPPYALMSMTGPPPPQMPVAGPPPGAHVFGPFGPMPMQQLPPQHPEQMYVNEIRPAGPGPVQSPAPHMFLPANHPAHSPHSPHNNNNHPGHSNHPSQSRHPLHSNHAGNPRNNPANNRHPAAHQQQYQYPHVHPQQQQQSMQQQQAMQQQQQQQQAIQQQHVMQQQQAMQQHAMQQQSMQQQPMHPQAMHQQSMPPQSPSSHVPSGMYSPAGMMPMGK